MSNSGNHHHPHVALLPSAGMGHLTPFLRLAASLVHHHHCLVTLITIQPTVSSAESKFISRFLSYFPQVIEKQLHLLPFDDYTNANTKDPFWLQWDATRRSAHLLSPLLSSLSPPLRALVSDVSLISCVIPVAANLSLPNYTLFTSSARMLSLFAYYSSVLSKISPAYSSQSSDVIDISGVLSIPESSIPPVLRVPDSFFASVFIEDGQNIKKLNGILVNTFERLEPGLLEALNGRKVVDGLPPVFTLGLAPYEFEKGGTSAPLIEWLDDQLAGSVVYINFGSRTAMSREQIRAIGNGLIRSGYPFIWVVKDKIVDKEDKESLDKVMGDELMEKIKGKGLVVKEWVDQGTILAHRGVGGFVSHCGWNSVVEAAWHGVRLLAWPQMGDQMINAEVVDRSGLGLWPKSWGWHGEQVVKGEEIGNMIKEMMGSDLLRLQAQKLKMKQGRLLLLLVVVVVAARIR